MDNANINEIPLFKPLNSKFLTRFRLRYSSDKEPALKGHFKTIRVMYREANPTGQVFIAGSFARIPVLINDRQVGQTGWREGCRVGEGW